MSKFLERCAAGEFKCRIPMTDNEILNYRLGRQQSRYVSASKIELSAEDKKQIESDIQSGVIPF